MSTAARHSLRVRLIIGAAVGVIVMLALAGLFIANLYRVHTTDRFETELDHHLEELVAMTSVGTDNVPRVKQPLSDPQFKVPRSGLYWQINDDHGSLLRSPSVGADRLTPSTATADWHAGRFGTEPVILRSVHRTLPDGHAIIVTMASARSLLEAQVGQFRTDVTVSMLALGLLLFGGAAALVRFGLAPVTQLGEEVDRLRHGEIDKLGSNVPEEFVPVVERINALLDGQAQLITRARTESGNLAHNLRTPLALITDEAEQLRLAGHTGPADFLLARCAMMQRQIDYHLTRASVAGTRGAGTLTEVQPLVEQIVEAMARLHIDRRIQIHVDLQAGLRLPCDRGDLAEILSNLIDNACKWAKRDVFITGGGGFVEVRDDGMGIPADKREIVVAVGIRLDPSKPGTGLGLAATCDILTIYGAALMLDTAPEGGLSARAAFAKPTAEPV